MKIKYMAVAVAAMFATAGLSAQSAETIISGQLYSQSTFGYTDILRLSQFNSCFGTARSSAMGGAFTSLGGDLASMNINPAGLGMYTASEFALTPAVSIGSLASGGAMRESGNSTTRFAPNNIGMALNLFEGSGGLTSFTFGFGYNKLADFNQRTTMRLPDDNGTIGDIFLRQLQGFRAGDLLGDSPWGNYSIPVFDWGAVMAFKSSLIDEDPFDDPDATSYVFPTVSRDAMMEHYVNTVSKGSIGEYSLSGGFNLRNRLYLGFTLGLQIISIDQHVYYDEIFTNNEGADAPDYAQALYFDQSRKFRGSGVNLKLGAIYRPTDALRIGVALHTPTMATVRMQYQAAMDTYFNGGAHGWASTPVNTYDYDYTTPTRLMAGVSYIFGDMGLLSVDYERTWYNGMRYSNDDPDKAWFKEEIKYLFKGGSTVRAGAEIKPIPVLSLRGGFSWSGDMIRKYNFTVNVDKFDSPVAYDTYNVSGGIGFHLGRATTLDLTYVFMNTKFTEYDLYLYQERNPADHSEVYNEVLSGNLRQQLKRHNIMATFAVRF